MSDLAEVEAAAHGLAGRPHLGAKDDIDASELDERKDALLHRDMARDRVFRLALLLEADARHHFRRNLRHRHAGRLQHAQQRPSTHPRGLWWSV